MIASDEEVRAWFPKVDLDIVDRAHHAAETFIAQRCRWPQVDAAGVVVEPPGDLVEAVHLLVSRLLARRNSPDGIVGMNADFGPVRITHVDRDVMALMAPYRPVVFG